MNPIRLGAASAAGILLCDGLRRPKCVFRRSVTARFGIVTAEFGSVTDHFGDVTDGCLVPA